MLPKDKLSHRLVPIVAEELARNDTEDHEGIESFIEYAAQLYRYNFVFNTRVDKQVGRIIETIRELEKQEGGE